MPNPKLFISYSWTTQDHEEWVLKLATELRESGVDVILDKWDLKEGHDANAFMEKMVNDPEIKKVALICDKVYVEKANGRSGGVGTETQIISSEVYAKQNQDKFVAILKERDENGDPYLPAYYLSRIYIDLSTIDYYVSNFDQLLRWIYNKPLYIRPSLGNKPEFLNEDKTKIHLGTTSRQKRAVEAIRNNKPYLDAAIREYFNVFSTEMESLRLESRDDEQNEYDEKVIESITAFLPYRNEAIELFLTIANYNDNNESRVSVHRFFESLIPYFSPAKGLSVYRDWDFDNFKFIIHELFLYAIASFIKYERFESASHLIQNEYYVHRNSNYYRDVMVPFNVFRQPIKTLEYRNSRLKQNRLSIHADLLKERCKGVGVDFRDLMQADFILFLRDHLDHQDNRFHWYPISLLYACNQHSAFEIFARSKSTTYFENIKLLLGIQNKEDVLVLLETFQKNKDLVPRWQFETFSPMVLSGLNELSIKP